MDYEKASVWIQLASGVAIMIGLGLVLWELNQNEQLTRVQIAQGTFTEMSTEQTSLYGENVARTLGRACTKPSQLSEEELVVLDSFFQNQMVRVMRLKSQADLAGFNAPWKRDGVAHTRRIARYPQGKSWLKLFVSRLATTDAELAAFIEEQLETVDHGGCAEILDSLRTLHTTTND